MQINLRLGGYRIKCYSNLEEYRNILPKSININESILDFDYIKLILKSIDPSILSFNKITVSLKSERNFEELLILSNLAKCITLHMEPEVNKWKVKEFPKNY